MTNHPTAHLDPNPRVKQWLVKTEDGFVDGPYSTKRLSQDLVNLTYSLNVKVSLGDNFWEPVAQVAELVTPELLAQFRWEKYNVFGGTDFKGHHGGDLRDPYPAPHPWRRWTRWFPRKK